MELLPNLRVRRTSPHLQGKRSGKTSQDPLPGHRLPISRESDVIVLIHSRCFASVSSCLSYEIVTEIEVQGEQTS